MAILFLLQLWKPEFRQIALINLVTLISNTIVVFIFKFTIRRTRKSSDYFFINKIDPYSFPSGHVSRLAGFIFSSVSFPLLSVLFLFLCGSTTFARMIKRYHYFSDCYAGFMLGLAVGSISLAFSGCYLQYMEMLINFIAGR